MVYSDQSASPPAPAPAEGTRERVLQLVLTRGPVSAAEIGRELELTAAAVRRHLDALEEDSLVEVKRVTAARGAGRPSRRYVVTSHAQEHLPKDHLAVALDTLARLEELGGEEEVRRAARHAFREIEERFTAAVGGRETALQERTRILARVLDEAGYAGTLRHFGAGLAPTLRADQVCQGHCPFQGIPARHPEFCEEETALFARLLEVDVRRLSTLAAGAHVCTTHVPLGRD
ncbi:helix-turn-helix domain-containing protein [Micrococcus luteus]|uniref:helix-turn-helix transcriptional regulator n=1 Tax=Micrococcus TaxID=1269 RepID=UPI0012F2A70A|nr:MULTISPECIES: helix-turn-helix domain-containing protein [Micrococcus]MCV7510765.1 helix-turn-helix domain-containing protein [Micrococcus luteus]MCV7521226.1 helix-turn-helix domain-containing protein [Micrococcus luteus]MCV7570964.1 helix-turn-helix domain-containing protein [Micrococcus luteus]MCV7624482.1 helix-turn-helix domain-containing protein [Micrococcus luteus]MCV7694382.1 helix-turn-helix domain-containing protein [Micrococcus luteus]